MQQKLPTAVAVLALGLTGGALLDGCGGGTDTVSVAESPAAATTTTNAPAPQTTSTATASAPASVPAQTTTSGGTAAPSTTRTAPEPAFSQQEKQPEGVGAATDVLRSRGYAPSDTSQYHENQTLRVLVGTRSGSSDGYGQQAFFFLGGHYLGTDAKEPSATVKVVSQSDTEVTLAYPLYHPNDPLSSPSGGQAIVHFQLDNGQLTPLGQIPPANSASGVSRN